MADGRTLVTIDVGTSGARATAFDLSGQRLAEARRTYPIHSPHAGWAEQDPAPWRRASLATLTTLAQGLPSGRHVVAIGLTGQCPSFVLTDFDGRPTCAGLTYRDDRASVEAQEIREREPEQLRGDVKARRQVAGQSVIRLSSEPT